MQGRTPMPPQALLSRMKVPLEAKVLLGFDGFVDSICRPVSSTTPAGNDYFPTIPTFGDYLSSKAGKSCCVELEVAAECAGGNMVLCAKGLGALGASTCCIGALGSPHPLPIFAQHMPQAQLHSICEPGLCTALEFEDGKIMLSRSSAINAMDYDRLIQGVGTQKLVDLLAWADAVSFLNWSELMGATAIWRGVLTHILPSLPREGRKLFLTDISDCSRRSQQEVREIMGLLGQYRAYFRTVISFNLHEAEMVAKALGCQASDPCELAAGLYQCLNVDTVAIHLLGHSVGCDGEGIAKALGNRVTAPMKSTGGGDHYNAGLLYGLLAGLALADALQMGNLVGECYVTSGASPSLEAVCAALAR